MTQTEQKIKRGFAAMNPERQRKIARAGGKAAHAQGKAHQFTTEEARAAGRRSHELRRAHQFTPEEASAASQKGHRARNHREKNHDAG